MERRRGVRVPVRVWTKIAGVDDDWQLRRGDISVSGIYLAVDASVGEPGSVQSVGIASYDRAESTEVLARVVRVSTVNDLWRGSAATGIAMEFLVENAAKREALESVIRSVIEAASHAAESLRFDVHFEAQVERQLTDGSAAVEALGVTGMQLKTTWKLPVGETIHCQIAVPGSDRSVAVSGETTAVTEDRDADPPRYTVDVLFTAPADTALIAVQETGTTGASITEAMDVLLEEVLFPDVAEAPARPREHLKGLLSRIRLPSLLAFFELERMSGVLRIVRDDEEACVFLREGRVVDVTLGEVERGALELLADMVDWDRGDFEFFIEPVEREDRLNTTTSALLLDFARRHDENGK